MFELTLSTSVDSDRTERGTVRDHPTDTDGFVLETEQGTRPDFRVEGDGSVTLLPANHHCEIDDFGQFVDVAIVE